MGLSLAFAGCRAVPATKTAPAGPTAGKGAPPSLDLPRSLSTVRSCDELRQLKRPAVAGTSCLPLYGGYVALVATSQTESWDDADGEQHGSTSSFAVWAYLPARPPRKEKGAQAVSPPAESAERPQRLNWRDGDGCTEGSSSGGGESAQTQCSLLIAHDLDDDGEIEIVLKKYEASASAGCCSTLQQTYRYVFYTVEDGTLVPSKRFPAIEDESDSLSVRDQDRDGRPDLVGNLGYKIPAACGPPGFLLHSAPGGVLSRDDATARQAARGWCPRPPSEKVTELRSDELAKYVLCARLWGESPAKLRARLAPRCATQESAVLDAQGQPSYPFPWQFCYREGIECGHPELRTFCGPWLDALIDAEPPFRF